MHSEANGTGANSSYAMLKRMVSSLGLEAWKSRAVPGGLMSQGHGMSRS